MKKFYGFTVLLTLLILGSCIREESGGNGNTDMAVKENPFFVSEEQAIDELYQFLDLVDPQTRGERRTVANVKTWNNLASTRGFSLDSDVPLYVVNFENNAGFAIVSGDSRLTPIIAVIDEGNFDPDDEEDDEEENPGFDMFLDLLSGYIKGSFGPDAEGSESTGGYGQSNDHPNDPGPAAPPGASSVVKAWETLEEVGSIIPSKWNQGPPFNDNCGGKPAGCGAIAVAQVMYHFQKDNLWYYWDVMSKIIDGSENEDAPKAMVAKFIRELGDRDNLNMNYDSDGSNCNIWNISKTFKNFGYKEGGDWKWGYNADRIGIYLKIGPVIVSGFEKIFLGVPSGGHYWVVDKYVKQQQVTEYYSNSTGRLMKSTSVERELVHCNWGKRANSKNGYFYNGVFDSNNKPPEQPTRGENDYYQYYMCMVTYISPDDIL